MSGTALNTANNDTRSFDMAMLKLDKKISYARSMPPAAKKNESFIGGGRHGVVCRDVI